MSDPVLSARAVSKSFSGLLALSDFSLDLQQGEIVGLIGPNGAGKTTCFNVLTGFLTPTQGEVRFQGQGLGSLSAAQVARLGVARTFQNIRLFGALSVRENVATAAQLHTRAGLWSTLINAPHFRQTEAAIRARADELLAELGLSDLAERPAASLPYGHQRRLEIARALATRPKVLLLDEPAAGMNPAESDALHHLIRGLRDRYGVGILLVEHDMRLVMTVCERLIVLSYGKTLAVGTPDVIRRDPRVIEAYLGSG